MIEPCCRPGQPFNEEIEFGIAHALPVLIQVPFSEDKHKVPFPERDALQILEVKFWVSERQADGHATLYTLANTVFDKIGAEHLLIYILDGAADFTD